MALLANPSQSLTITRMILAYADFASQQKAIANREATTAEKLAVLEETKARLVTRKTGLEDKIAQLESRAAGRGEDKTQGRPLHGIGGE